MTTEWDEIKSAFSDGTNTGFQTDVVLRARKFDGEKIYECGFLPDDMVEYSLAGDRHYQRIGRRPRSRQSCHSNPWFKADDVNLLRAVTHLSSFLLCHTFTSSSLLHTIQVSTPRTSACAPCLKLIRTRFYSSVLVSTRGVFIVYFSILVEYSVEYSVLDHTHPLPFLPAIVCETVDIPTPFPIVSTNRETIHTLETNIV